MAAFRGLTVAFLLIFTFPLFAQQPPGPRPDNPEILNEGRLVTLRFIPGDGRGKLFLAGRKAADIDLRKNQAKLVSVTLFKNSKTDTLAFKRVGDSLEEYEVSGLPRDAEPYDLDIKAQTRGKFENMKLHVAPKKP